MNSTHRNHVILVTAVALVVLPPLAFSQHPAGVSPGAEDRAPAIEGRCPSFSWVEATETAFYELVVYRLAEDLELGSSADLDLEHATEVLTSVTIGTDGLGLISYYYATNDDLKVAHRDDTLCTSAALSTVDSAGSVGTFTSVTIGADGLGLVSYYDATNDDLNVVHLPFGL
jgi:hypothetical protein